MRNKERDLEVNEELSKKGWRVFPLWEYDVEKDIDGSIIKNLNLYNFK